MGYPDEAEADADSLREGQNERVGVGKAEGSEGSFVGLRVVDLRDAVEGVDFGEGFVVA